MVLTVEAIDVLEGSVCGLRVEEVDDGQEGEVEDDPDDVEAPAEGLDADGSDFDDCEVRRGSAYIYILIRMTVKQANKNLA